MRLSRNFTLEEFLRSQTATRNDIDMTPPPEVVENIRRLVNEILQPLRDAVNTVVTVTSGYRPLVLNRLIGGSSTSQHVLGEAADIVVVGMLPIDVARVIRDLELPYWQLIHEFGQWTHVSIAPNGSKSPKRQILTALRDQGRTVYREGLLQAA